MSDAPVVGRLSRPSKIVLVSASVPDPNEWTGIFDPFAITDAVVATARAVFTRGGAVLTAAHPTIAPLILFVADELPAATSTRVILYQSRLFEEVIPTATREMMSREYVEVVWTPAAPGERPVRGNSDQSLATMRDRMMTDVTLDAAVFIGGMSGITDEFDRVGSVHPEAQRYALGRPGGEAASLSNSNGRLAGQLRTSDLFPWLLDQVADEIFGSRDG